MASIAVLTGGTSLEREVSLRSGSRVADALRDRGHQVATLDTDADLVRTLAEGNHDVAFLTLHGAAGEDGTIQSVLELLGLPYTGPDVLASSLAWNKPIAQGLYRRAGLAVPAFVTLTQEAFREMGASAALDRLTDRLTFPLVVKPATGGSSLGLAFVDDNDALPRALVGAFSYADAVIIEQAVVGTEVAVSIIDGEALPAVEIQPKEGVYDFSARYTAGTVEFHVPARLEPAVADAVQAASVAAYEAVGARHVSRCDLIVDAQGTPYVLELDTCPGMTETSLLPLAAQAAGLDFADLCERLVTLAIRS
ncbi:MAG: D-alanine--D-alanine ligase [Nitriliruptorales bacterium]|nr:D-alanine--D-alanine ligase [Nitriliruptorales bacterium]